MDTPTFSGIFGAQIEQIESALIDKADEYATEDRLHNFKVAAELQDENATQALGGMMAKHTVSIYNMINSGEAFPKAVWEEKIGDHLTYLLLLRATIVEDGLILEEETPAEQDRARLARFNKEVIEPKTKAFTDEATRRLFPSTEKYPDASAYSQTVAYFEEDVNCAITPHEDSELFARVYERFAGISGYLISEKRRPSMWDKYAGFNVMTETEEEFEKRKVGFLNTGDTALLKTPTIPLTTEKPRHQI